MSLLKQATTTAALFLALLPAIGTAESINAEPETSEFALPEVVVTATKTNLSVKDVPAAISVLTQKDIVASGARTLSDVISQLPGTAIQRANGRRILSLRGFDGRYSVILINGIRLPAEPDAPYELDRISLENIERIEVLRGPSSALYGADALGGVLQIITKQPQEAQTRLTIDYPLTRSTDEAARYSASFDSGRQGKYSFHLSGSHFTNEKHIKSDGTTYLPFGDRNNLAAQIDYFPSQSETLSLTVNSMRENSHEYSRLQSMAGLLSTDLYDDNQRDQYSLLYKQQLNNGEWQVQASHSVWNKYNETYRRDNGFYLNSVYGYYTISTLEGRLTKQWDAANKWTFGAEIRPELFRGTGIQTGSGNFTNIYHGRTYQGSETKTTYSALYLQDEWQAAPKLFLTAAARYDSSDAFNDNISPKLGLTYTADSSWRIKLNAGKGFRVPAPNQRYLNLTVTRNGRMVNLVGNPHLEPEHSRSFDLSVEHDFGPSTAKLTYFTNNVSDMIDEVWVNPNRIEYQNINAATLQGLEAELTYPLSSKSLWRSNYTYLNAKNDATGNRLFHRAKHKLGAQLEYRPDQHWLASLGLDSYIDYVYQDAAGSAVHRTYQLWNLTLEHQLTSNTALQLGIDNLFNRELEDLAIPGRFIHLQYKLSL